MAGVYAKDPTKEKDRSHRSVSLSGINPCTSDELIELFFENRRRTGGGPIECVTRNREGNGGNNV